MLAILLLLPPPTADYRALGTEPFWSLHIGIRTMRLDRVGQPRLSVRTPAPWRTAGGSRYATRRLSVTILRRACSDGMSDRRYRDTVTVVVRGQTLRGCGGPFSGPAAP